MQNVKLQYHGFKPSAFVRRYLNSALVKSAEDAPEKSFLVGHFSRNKKVIKGFVQLSSHLSQVSAVAEGERLKEVTKKISAQLKKKIQKRNKIRMRHERISEMLGVKDDALNENEIADVNTYLENEEDFHDFKNSEQQALQSV